MDSCVVWMSFYLVKCTISPPRPEGGVSPELLLTMRGGGSGGTFFSGLLIGVSIKCRTAHTFLQLFLSGSHPPLIPNAGRLADTSESEICPQPLIWVSWVLYVVWEIGLSSLLTPLTRVCRVLLRLAATPGRYRDWGRRIIFLAHTSVLHFFFKTGGRGAAGFD